MLLALSLTVLAGSVYAQAPTGTILGTIADASGAVIANAPVTITNKATSAARNAVSNAEGLYSAPALAVGDYEVRAEVQGFRTLVREAEVTAGGATTVDLAMTVGTAAEVVNVEAASTQVNFDSNAVQGVIQRATIQDLPLNGRSILQLAALEPGVTIGAATLGIDNQQFTVSVLGAATGTTLYTIDGAEVNNMLGGGIAMQFSQDVVQEFQLSSVNFDLSTGTTSSGSVNVVTRSGANEFHGSAYFFFRDHNMAAYPLLKRVPTQPNIFFARRNPGFLVSGPIIKDKLFFFYNLEHLNQTQAIAFQPDLASVAGLGGAFPSPYTLTTQTARFDYHYSSRNNFWGRWSQDSNLSFGLQSGLTPDTAGYAHNKNLVDQYIVGATTIVTPNIVNDFHAALWSWSNRNTQAPNPPVDGLTTCFGCAVGQTSLTAPATCVDPTCVGGGLPPVTSMVGSSSFVAGENSNTPQDRLNRRFDVGDNVTWQKGQHRMRFGFDLVYDFTDNYYHYCNPFCISVYSPETVLSTVGAANAAQYFPTLPNPVKSTNDILNLPVSNSGAVKGTAGITVGSPYSPGLYNTGKEATDYRPRWFGQDTWKLRSNLTVNFGVGYAWDNSIFDSDLPKAPFLAPIFGANNLHATPVYYGEVSPVIGFAWSPFKNNKTVIRGGAGIYWDTLTLTGKSVDQAIDGPAGNGLITIGANALVNTFPGIVAYTGGKIVPVAQGANLPLTTLTNMTLGQQIQLYNAQIANITAQLVPATYPTSGPIAVTGIDLAKQGAGLYPPNYKPQHSYQTSIGVQRELGYDIVLQADYARRVFADVSIGSIDLNHYNEFINGVRSPVIPACSPISYTPGVECSNGAITVTEPYAHQIYNGLLVKVTKRFSHRTQFVVGYALQSLIGNGAVVNLNNYAETAGNLLARHNLNVAGTVNLPYGFQLSVNSSIISASPFTAYMPGIDLSGTSGTANNLPGLQFGCLNMGCSHAQLATAVANFDATYAGTKAPNGTSIPTFVLPPQYNFGAPLFSQDFRLTKSFAYKEKYKLSVFAEMFNSFNVGNTSGYSTSLDTLNPNPAAQTYAFGQPTTRVTQVFGSGGPRAVQVGTRFTF